MQKHCAVFIFALVAAIAISGEARRSGSSTSRSGSSSSSSTTATTVAPATAIDPAATFNFIVTQLFNFIQDILTAVISCAPGPQFCGLDGLGTSIIGCLACITLNLPLPIIPPIPANVG